MNPQTDRQRAAKWAHDLLQQNDWCILDTETTGLDRTAEICRIAIIDPHGNVLLDSYVCPMEPINLTATEIHGISNSMIQDAPPFPELLVPILKAVGTRSLVIYNAEFDLKLIRQSLRPYGIQIAFPTSDRRQCRIFPNGGSILCAMEQYSQWVGEWNERYGNYKWQKLPNGDHSALGDCRATLNVIRQMAASYQPVDPLPVETDL